MEIAGYIKTSLIEWPGKISSVIFTPGCNFRCPFCHNRELIERYKDTKIQRYKEKDILVDLKKRKKWVDGVVITGGEPTLQEDLDKFLRLLKELGFLTMIHTNGTKPKIIDKLLNCQIVDYVCMDLKGNFDGYDKFIGAKSEKLIAKSYGEKLKTSLSLLLKSGVEYEFRTTVVPGLHDIKNLISLAEQINFLAQSTKHKVQSTKWYLQQFRPLNTLDKKYMKVKPYSKEEMEGFQKGLREIIPQTFLRGI